MSEKKAEEPAITHESVRPPLETTDLPREFAWLHSLTPGEQDTFLHDLFETLVQVWQDADLIKLGQEVEAWQRRQRLLMVAADRRLLRTAQAEGLIVFDPEQNGLADARLLLCSHSP